MAKAKLSALLQALSGQIDGFAVQAIRLHPRREPPPANGGYRAVAGPARPTAEIPGGAAAFHRQLLANPELKARYIAAAKQQWLPLSAVTMRAIMQQPAEAAGGQG